MATTLRIDKDLKKQLRIEAINREVSMNTLLKNLVLAFLEEKVVIKNTHLVELSKAYVNIDVNHDKLLDFIDKGRTPQDEIKGITISELIISLNKYKEFVEGGVF